MANPLAKYRRILLLTELMGIIHDIGKVGERLVLEDGLTVGAYVNHILAPFKEWDAESDMGMLKHSTQDGYSQYISPKKGAIFELAELNHLFPSNKKINIALKDIFADFSDELVCNLFKEDKSGASVRDIPLRSLFLRHHSYYTYSENLRPNSTFTRIMSDCDSMDSKEDRLKSTGRKYRQTSQVLSVFGEDKSTDITKNLNDMRIEAYDLVLEILNKFTELKQYSNDEEIDQPLLLSLHKKILTLKQKLNFAPAMSVFPENDTTVWDHSFMTASLAKAAVAKYFLHGTPSLQSKRDKKFLSILAVQFPGRDILTEVYRMPDFVGREKKLEDIRRKVQNLVESEYSLGNLVYEDINGLYFIIPRLNHHPNLRDELKRRIKEQFRELVGSDSEKSKNGATDKPIKHFFVPYIYFEDIPRKKKFLNFGLEIVSLKRKYETTLKRKIAGIRTDRLELPEWCEDWKNANYREVCHVCRRMPVQHYEKERYEGDKLCTSCSEIRTMGLHEGREQKVARFIDQVMDENKKIVLLTGELGLFDLWLKGDYIVSTRYEAKGNQYPKRVSPSRIRGVYEEAQEFQDIVEEFLKSHANLRGFVPIFKLNAPLDKPGFWVHQVDQVELKDTIRYQLTKTVAKEDKRVKDWVELTYNQITNQSASFKFFVPENSIFAEGLIAYSDFSLNEWGKDTQQLLADIFREYFAVSRKFSPDGIEVKQSNVEVDLYLKVQWKEIAKYRKVYGMTDEYMYLLPTNQVIPIINGIGNMFDKKFGRVKGRLTLNIGMVFSDHKYPLYLILDSGKRMLKEFREMVTQPVRYYNNEVYGLTAKLSTQDGKRFIEFDDIMKGDKIEYNLPQNVYIEWNDNYFGGVISRSQTPKMLGADAIQQLREPEPILYAPDLVDFEYMDNIRSRINIALDKTDGLWKKRKHQIWKLHKRPYTREQFCEFSKFNHELNLGAVSASSLKNLETGLIGQLQSLFLTEKDFLEKQDLLKKMVYTLVMNIDSFKDFFTSLPKDRKDAWLEMITDGRFFDLMELRTFIQVFANDKGD